eukprot:NODE_10778_length_577_cov_31.156388_g10501_i0.p1 GENE.NODE_10778_length_577_cov_31.156388_g10501_i0~~NODE_10778_length_577_cov_31.156388_g10501_i0.p1  ORF type:complete len:107 (+),score=13.83 NODE_10778_length_577_cov_31.156388_g10501_i0:254-574(+)
MRLRAVYHHWIQKKQGFDIETYFRCQKILRGMAARALPARHKFRLGKAGTRKEMEIARRLRVDMEKMRLVVDRIQAREKVKRKLLLAEFDVFMRQVVQRQQHSFAV